MLAMDSSQSLFKTSDLSSYCQDILSFKNRFLTSSIDRLNQSSDEDLKISLSDTKPYQDVSLLDNISDHSSDVLDLSMPSVSYLSDQQKLSETQDYTTSFQSSHTTNNLSFSSKDNYTENFLYTNFYNNDDSKLVVPNSSIPFEKEARPVTLDSPTVSIKLKKSIHNDEQILERNVNSPGLFEKELLDSTNKRKLDISENTSLKRIKTNPIDYVDCNKPFLNFSDNHMNKKLDSKSNLKTHLPEQTISPKHELKPSPIVDRKEIVDFSAWKQKLYSDLYPTKSESPTETLGDNLKNLQTYQKNRSFLEELLSNIKYSKCEKSDEDEDDLEKESINFGLEDVPTPIDFKKHYQYDFEISIIEDEDEDSDDLVQGSDTNFVKYKTSELFQNNHPSPIVETASLSYVNPPKITYKPLLYSSDSNHTEIGLSGPQIEAVCYACQAHLSKLPNGDRVGFLIGDGVGLGKGRIIAGTIKENWMLGRRRSIWVSVSNDLKVDAKRDLNDVGAENIPIVSLTHISYDRRIEDYMPEGVLFCTYASLLGARKPMMNKYSGYTNRLDQIIDWCTKDFDGLITFDECHKGSNFKKTLNPRGKSKLNVGSQVYNIQNKLKNARVLYVSATTASEPADFCHMVRLGLWGQGLPFKDVTNFLNFASDLNMMELIAMDLKQRGLYMSRKLSFQGVEYDICNTDIPPDIEKVYDKSCYFWKELISKQMNRAERAFFWGSHLRYFKYLSIASKVPYLIDLVSESIKDNYCVVIGLQLTGESAREQLDITDLETQVSPARSVLDSLYKKMPNVFSPKAIELMNEIKPLLPRNPLDEIIERLGGHSKVAEMTGRKQSSRTKNNSQYIGRVINPDDINLREKESFMSGEKLVAVISEAASTGISLQSDRRVLNQRKRLHICLELPWSADRALQQMGRTHRSNQILPPKYLILISKLAGEHRFAFSLAQRLKMLGALTQGDRQVQEGSMLSKFGLNQFYADMTVEKIFKMIKEPSNSITPNGQKPERFCRKLNSSLKSCGIIDESKAGKCSFTKFLNRLLGLPIKMQDIVFDIFRHIYNMTIKEAIKNNVLSDGISYIEARKVSVLRSYEITKIGVTGEEKSYFKSIKLGVGMHWQDALTKYNKHSDKLQDQSKYLPDGFYIKKKTEAIKRIVMILRNKEISDEKDQYYNVYNPGYDGNSEIMTKDKIKRMYKYVSKVEAEKYWNNQFSYLSNKCIHHLTKKLPCEKDCQKGKTIQDKFILTGSILSIAADLKKHNKLQLSRIKYGNNPIIVGIEVPRSSFLNVKRYFKSDDEPTKLPNSENTVNSQAMSGGSCYQRVPKPIQGDVEFGNIFNDIDSLLDDLYNDSIIKETTNIPLFETMGTHAPSSSLTSQMPELIPIPEFEDALKKYNIKL